MRNMAMDELSIYLAGSLRGPIPPGIHPSAHIDCVDSLLFESIGGCLTSRSTPAVHEVGLLLLEFAETRLQIGERHVLGVWDVTEPPLQSRSHVNHLEVRIVLVIVDHFFGLGGTHAHYLVSIINS
jgi:hypothetical protein